MSGGETGIEVRRRLASGRWMADLWLAERVAAAAEAGAPPGTAHMAR
ncbi:MAG: hypothetical protein H0V25_02380 [Solirubrobacterales bacterium]|nr:hypothetical protein [Solirubrobacterales bacterium]